MNRIDEILSWYSSENPGVLTNLYRILCHGKLAGTGRILMLPADQGVEHGPGRSFLHNPAAYDPRYHVEPVAMPMSPRWASWRRSRRIMQARFLLS
jgi:class I fructose-bisphosphate aldolase